MNSQKDRKRDLSSKDVCPKKKETFWTSGPLMERLATIPEGEKSTIIRMALRDWFELSDSKRGIVEYKEVGHERESVSSQAGHN